MLAVGKEFDDGNATESWGNGMEISDCLPQQIQFYR